ncbi:MFS transporter [Streptomyces sp. NPDC056224]|uniref:MFS transporter n=1 Tax=Streptomyces sp. NPDC056224 TaxID=3345750 RepID=UPI0035D65C8F
MTSSQLTKPRIPGAARREGRPGVALAVIAACQLMVVLDATIVNIALPHIQTALDFSTTDLSWVLSAYTLTFGGLLLLGGRAGDILGRRRVFMAGILLFTLASLLGGFAQEPWQLLAARALQGVGGAIASPTSLALITTTFPEGPERNRAFGVFAAVSAGGGAIGLLAGGMLTEWLDWRWVLFVNVPIGVLIATLAPLYISESERHPGRFDAAGALTSTGGMASLVYGFIRASEDGWRDSLTLGSFAAAVVLLALFVAVESRAPEPIIPLRMFADRNRAGTYVIMLGLAAAMFGMFFFIVQFVQNVLGFSPIQSGLGFLPVTAAIVTAAGLSQRFLPRLGPKPFMVTGTALVGTGLTWLAFIRTDSSYLAGVLGPMLLFGFGMGLNFVTLTLTAVSGVAPKEAGAASGLLNASQQVGGSLGLSILVTVFGTAARTEADRQVPLFMAQARPDQLAAFEETGQLPDPWGDLVLTQGISTAFGAAVAMAGLALATALLVIRVRKSDLDALNGAAEKSGPAA